MAEDLASLLAQYDYQFPPELLANEPVSPRDSAKLAVFRRATGQTEWTTVANIAEFLPAGALLVRNRTKVVPARLVLRRWSGGQVEVLVTGSSGNQLTVLANRRLKLGEILQLSDDLSLTVKKEAGRGWQIEAAIPVSDVLQRYGQTPLPPYMKDSPLSETQRRERYQSVFAEAPGSIAAPTASLHFTPELLGSLEAQGFGFADVVLHVNLGTFAPLKAENLASGRLHEERYELPPEAVLALEEAKKSGRPIIPIGTTALRAIESSSDESGRIVRPSGVTDLFIREGYRFHLATGLMTNFHVPKSSLLMLVAAMMGRERLLKLYDEAVERRFRLFSFGDAMLVV